MRLLASCAAVLLALPLLSGCGKVYLIEDGRTTLKQSKGLGDAPRLPLGGCVKPSVPGGEGSLLYRIGARAASSVFERAYDTVTPRCDVLVSVTTSRAWRWDVYSARTEEALFTVRGQPGAGSNLESWMPRALHERLSEPALQQRLIAERTLAPREAAPSRPVASSEPPAASRERTDADAPAYRQPEREHDAAVVIGVEDYSDLPKAEFAARDAQAFKAHLVALGVPERNIALLVGQRAGKASVEKNIEQWLPRVTEADSRVFVYFSGHGAPDPKTGEAYLMPWDGDPNFLESTAYPVKRLYQKLAALKAREVVVALDSCFSGAGGRSVLPRGARPLVTKSVEEKPADARISVLTASDAGEISGTLASAGHGLFTYQLLAGLNGAAGSPVTLGGLHRYLAPKVADEAKRENRDQHPQLLGDGSLRLR